MKNYGLPYQGSKNKIAEDIIDFLPQGNRLVDLFGGGGAISHCASLSGKWNSVLYNELNPLIFKGFKMAVNGEFNTENRWISHEDFDNLKGTDPYVAICFSFSNNLIRYAYGQYIEPWKKAIHYARVFNDYSEFKKFGIDTDGSSEEIRKHEESYKEKYLDWYKNNFSSVSDEELIDSFSSFTILESLQRQNRIKEVYDFTRLQSLARSKILKGLTSQATRNIELVNGSYLDYQYQEGDVVYCDPPYENTDCGGYEGFNHKEFYEWVHTRPYQVFFSSYEISDKTFHTLWLKKKLKMSGGNSIEIGMADEYIYSNMPYIKEKITKQNFIFG